MIQKRITYTNFNNEEVTRTFYFNWTIDELAEWEQTTPGGVQKWIDDIIHARTDESVMSILRKAIGMSIGERSEDGESFVKNKKIRKHFLGSNAYSVMLTEFMKDADLLSEFFNNLLPVGVEEINKIAEANEKAEAKKGDAAIDQGHTTDQLLSMSEEEFFSLAGGKKPHKMRTKQFKDVALMRQTIKRANSQGEKTAA